MNDSLIKDLSETLITSETEAELAKRRQQENKEVFYHQGRYWEELRSGFYQPIHLLARLKEKQATKPKSLCWGFRSALVEHDKIDANGSIAVHLLSDISEYDLQSLSSNRRNHVRRCRKRAKIVQIIGSELLQEQGYQVMASALKRAAYKDVPSKNDYDARFTGDLIPKTRLILGGLIDGKLGGYIEGYAIDGTAYIQDIHISTEALSSYIGTGLVFEFVQVCIRSGNIQEIVYGQHSREDSKLCVFKEGMGFPAKHVPAKVEINPVIGKLINWRRPDSFYRLAGSVSP